MTAANKTSMNGLVERLKAERLEAENEERTTTKACPQCGNAELAKVGTLHFKYCADCNLEIPWFLEEGQEPVYGGVLKGAEHGTA